MPDQPVEVTSLRLSVGQVVAVVSVIVTVLLSGAATYYGITAHLSAMDGQIRALTDDNKALQRQVLELTVTLRTKGVIQ